MVAHSLSSCIRLARTPCCNVGRNQLAGDARGGQGETENRWWRDRGAETVAQHGGRRDGHDGGSGVLVMFRRGDGDGDGKRSRKVNCSQLGPGLAGWFVGFGFGSSTPKDKKTGQSVADPGSARSAVPSARPQAPQQGGQTRRWWARTGTAFDSRPCRPSAEKEGPAFNPTTLPANPVPFFAGSWDACELQRPKHQLHLTKTPAAVIKLSPPRQVLFVKGGVISSPSLVFSIASISGRGKITKDKATP